MESQAFQTSRPQFFLWGVVVDLCAVGHYRNIQNKVGIQNNVRNNTMKHV